VQVLGASPLALDVLVDALHDLRRARSPPPPPRGAPGCARRAEVELVEGNGENGLVVAIHAPDEATALAVARILRPYAD
jgi:hypothetical protein